MPTFEVDLGVGIRAFFTSSVGGVSPAPWASLNLGMNVEDLPANVERNREFLGAELGEAVSFMDQVHGSHVVGLESPVGNVGTADAMVTTSAGVPLGVLVADCVPILLAAANGPVAVAHAGRRGLLDGVIHRTVEAMRAHGADEIRAVIGPSICGLCYEVPHALQQEAVALLPSTEATTRAGTPGLDLPAGARGILESLDVALVPSDHLCTMEDDRFFSYRRAEGQLTGRFAGVVMREP